MTVVAEGGALATRCPAMSGHRLSATRVGLRPPLHQTIPYVGNRTVWHWVGLAKVEVCLLATSLTPLLLLLLLHDGHPPFQFQETF